jgi:hypothetical protein
VKPPAPDRRKILPWSAERVAAVAAALPDRYRAFMAVAAGLGLRQGECFAWPSMTSTSCAALSTCAGKSASSPAASCSPRPRPARPATSPCPSRSRYGSPPTWKPGRRCRSPCRGASRPVGRRRPGCCSRPGADGAGPHVLQPACLEARAGGGRRAGDPGQRDARGPAPLRQCAAGGWREHPGGGRVPRAQRPGFTLRVYAHLMPSSEGRARVAVDRALGGSPAVAQAAAQDA